MKDPSDPLRKKRDNKVKLILTYKRQSTQKGIAKFITGHQNL